MSEKINVWAEYCWECSYCGETNRISYSPKMGEKLPPCENCENADDECYSISEACRP